MSQNKIKFVNNLDQYADSHMIMSFLNNSLPGAILKTKNGDYFIVVEKRERTTQNEYTSVFHAYTITKDYLGKCRYDSIARASTDEIYQDNIPDTYYLASLLVHDSYRDLGVGSAILEFLQSIAAERNFYQFKLNATSRPRPDRENPNIKIDANECFYIKNGFVPVEFRDPNCPSTTFIRQVRESDKDKNKSKDNEDELINSIL